MSGAGLVFSAAGSHLYKGAAGLVAGTVAAGPCLVEFADGSAPIGRLAVESGQIILDLGPYDTARGTSIPAKRWVVAVTGAGRRFRVLARAPSPSG